MGLFDRLLGGGGSEAKKRVDELQKRLKANPTNVACAIELADAMNGVGSGRQAVKILNEIAPMLQRKGQFLAAIAVYKKINELDPKAEDPATMGSLRELSKLQEQAAARTLPDTSPRTTSGIQFSAADAAEAQLKREALHPHIQKIPLFADVPPHLLDQLVQKIHQRPYDAGATIFEEGAPGSSLLFIVSGEVTVHGKGEGGREVTLRTMHAGDVLGEISFLASMPRSATVRTKAPSLLLEIDRRAVDPIVRKSPKLRETLTNLYKERVLNDVLMRSAIFGTLPKGARDVVGTRLISLMVNAGDAIPTPDGPQEGLFLIASGVVRVVAMEGEKEIERAILGPPQFFSNLGKSATGPVERGNATASAMTDVELFVLKPEDLSPLLGAAPQLWAAVDELHIDRLRSKKG